MEKPRAEFTLRIDPELLKKIDEAAASSDGISRNAYIVSKLRKTLPRNNKTA